MDKKGFSMKPEFSKAENNCPFFVPHTPQSRIKQGVFESDKRHHGTFSAPPHIPSAIPGFRARQGASQNRRTRFSPISPYSFCTKCPKIAPRLSHEQQRTMATFEKRPTGWRVKIRKGGVSESKTFATKAQAMAWAADRERELDDIAAGGMPRKTVREALERYLIDESPKKRGHKWEAVRINSWMGREDRSGEPSKLRVPWLDLQLSELGPEALAAWRDARLRSVAPGSVLRELHLMGAVLETARREWKWIKTNPLRDVRRPPQPEARTRRISEDEIARLCLALGWDEAPVTTQTQEVAAAFLLAIETAMRQGEILGLTWDTVDMSRRVARLPKTKNGSARDVPLSTRAMQLLELMRVRGDDRIFTVSSASADALFRRGKARAMIDGLHFHDTRREATSRLSKKVDVLTLARITGHKDIRMLMIYYQTDMADVAQQIG